MTIVPEIIDPRSPQSFFQRPVRYISKRVMEKRNSGCGSAHFPAKLFGIIGVWNEEDIIEATVRNAFEQGCERVYFVDNASTDGTVERALGVGAELIASYSAPFHAEGIRISLMNACARHISDQQDVDRVWWLWMDGDEFPEGPQGMTISQYLSGLDPEFETVGARYFDHYPMSVDGYKRLQNPLEHCQMCEERRTVSFSRGFYKHPLYLLRRGIPQVVASGGFHQPILGRRGVLRPSSSVYVHHYPFRNKENALRRLQSLVGTTSEKGRLSFHETNHLRAKPSGMTIRLRNLDAVYRQDWGNVMRPPRGPKLGVLLQPWANLVRAIEREVK